jgi:hypothetical protein
MFILDRPKSDKPTLIFIKKTLHDGPFKASLGVKLLPIHWNRDTKRAEITGLDRQTIEENKSINALIASIEKFYEGRTRDARHSGTHLTGTELQKKIDELTGKPANRRQTGPAFYPQCREVINDMETGVILTPQGKIYSRGTIKNYRQSLNTIEEYNAALAFEAINMDFYRSFIKWCNDKDYSMNYIAQHIKNLVCLMKATKKRGHHENTAYLDEDFRVIQEHTDDIALTEKELEALYKHNVPDRTRNIARDWFIIDCYTGLRVSDIQLLDAKNIHGDTITIANEKTDTKVVIPLRTEVKEIRRSTGRLRKSQKWPGSISRYCTF